MTEHSAPPDPLDGLSAATRRLWRVAAWLVVIFGALVRLAVPNAHFQDGRFIAIGPDAVYHARLATRYAVDFPWPGLWDPMLGWPQGAPNPWAPGWSAMLGWFAWLFGGGSSETFGFQVGLALLPMILGVLTVALALQLGTRIWGPRGGLVSGVCAALIPYHVGKTQFGATDHNAIECLFVLAMAAETARDRPRPWAIGALVAGACICWVGCYAYAAFATLALFLAACLEGLGPKKRGGDPFARAGVRGLLLGAVFMLPVALLNGFEAGEPFSYAYLSAFQPIFVAGLGLGSAWLLGLLFRPERRRQLLIGGGLALAVAAAAMGPAVIEGAREWLIREDPWLATVAEMKPALKGPFWSPGAWEIICRLMSWAYPFTLPLAGILGWRAIRQGRSDQIAVLTFAVMMFVLTLLQNRFGWTLAPLLALVVGGALSAVPLSPLLALLLFVRPDVAEMEKAYLMPKSLLYRYPWRFESYAFLREATAPIDPLDPHYGVASRWWHGHWISGLSERPEHVGNFGTYPNGIERYVETEAMFDGSEADLVAMMERDRLRYLMADAAELMSAEGPLRQLLIAGSAGVENPAVGRLRAIFWSRQRDAGVPYEGVPGSWVYELVPGAELVGRAPPGAEVEVELGVGWGGALRPWSANATADADGTWRIRVPYATGIEGPVPTTDVAFWRIGERQRSFQIPAGAVDAGAILEVPTGYGVRWGLEDEATRGP